jgi:hypothetical protein
VRGDFLESVDPVHAQDARVFVDGQRVFCGSADLLAVAQSDNEHNVVLSSAAGSDDPSSGLTHCEAGA